jgi:hypothetical protein
MLGRFHRRADKMNRFFYLLVVLVGKLVSCLRVKLETKSVTPDNAFRFNSKDHVRDHRVSRSRSIALRLHAMLHFGRCISCLAWRLRPTTTQTRVEQRPPRRTTTREPGRQL